jgi:predicted patatin/cPLA2 family phospholipase
MRKKVIQNNFPHKKESKNVLVAFGGAMSGVFGAGVVNYIKDTNRHHEFDAFYGVSAGAHNIAYMLSDNTKQGAHVYFDHLSSSKFIDKSASKHYFKTFLKSSIGFNHEVPDLINLDYVEEVQKNIIPLNINEVVKYSQPFNMRVFNHSTKQTEWVDGKTNTLLKLKATSALTPLYYKTITINNNEYSDSIIESNLVDDVLLDHLAHIDQSEYNILCIFNTPIKGYLSFGYSFQSLLWSLVLSLHFRHLFYMRKARTRKHFNNLVKLLDQENVNFIEGVQECSAVEQNQDKLQQIYKDGYEQAKKYFEQQENVL